MLLMIDNAHWPIKPVSPPLARLGISRGRTAPVASNNLGPHRPGNTLFGAADMIANGAAMQAVSPGFEARGLEVLNDEIAESAGMLCDSLQRCCIQYARSALTLEGTEKTLEVTDVLDLEHLRLSYFHATRD